MKRKCFFIEATKNTSETEIKVYWDGEEFTNSKYKARMYFKLRNAQFRANVLNARKVRYGVEDIKVIIQLPE